MQIISFKVNELCFQGKKCVYHLSQDKSALCNFRVCIKKTSDSHFVKTECIIYGLDLEFEKHIQ